MRMCRAPLWLFLASICLLGGNAAASCQGDQDCDDGNACTDDRCDLGSAQCVFTPDDSNTCSDGNPCTLDFCSAGVCSCACAPCSGTETVYSGEGTPVAIPDGAGSVTSLLVVSGAGRYVLDVDLRTRIRHSFPADLQVSVQSPAGTIVSLTTGNGGGNDNVFDGTRFSDQANPGGQVPYTINQGLATDHPYGNNLVVPSLAPEEALGAFEGEDPNGIWTLTVADTVPGNTGTLRSWALFVTTLPFGPVTTTTSFVRNAAVSIPPGPSVTTATLAVSGVGNDLGRLRMTTLLRHARSSQLQMALTSPSGRVVTITTDNGAADVFLGTLWDDDADPGGQVPYAHDQNLVTDRLYVDGVVATTLAPEEPLSAFDGQDPNGVWTLTIWNGASDITGSLDGFSLEVTTRRCGNVSCEDGNYCTDDLCDPASGCRNEPNQNPCSDDNACTTGDHCVDGSCVGGMPTYCGSDLNVCTNDSCNPLTGCTYTPNSYPCDDGDPCTADDVCGNGSCSGTPVTAPPEVAGLAADSDKQTLYWTATPYATSYDVVRGSLGGLPVGPGGGDEQCSDGVSGTSLADAGVPASLAGYFYVVRGQNGCGASDYGRTHVNPGPPLNGPLRSTASCP